MRRVVRTLRRYARWLVRVLPCRVLGPLGPAALSGGGFAFRPGTSDRRVYDAVVVWNEYDLPRRLAGDDVVIDIGGHIGAFAYACLIRGAGVVHLFEADADNLALAKRNLAPFAGRVVFHPAAWRSDGPPTTVIHSGYSRDGAEVDTAGGNVLLAPEGATVAAEPLDPLLASLPPVRLMKIDCEGSEFPILLTAGQLDRVREIVGEFHELGGPRDGVAVPAAVRVAGIDAFTIEALVAGLARRGFRTRWCRHGETSMGLFRARRAQPPPT